MKYGAEESFSVSGCLNEFICKNKSTEKRKISQTSRPSLSSYLHVWFGPCCCSLFHNPYETSWSSSDVWVPAEQRLSILKALIHQVSHTCRKWNQESNEQHVWKYMCKNKHEFTDMQIVGVHDLWLFKGQRPQTGNQWRREDGESSSLHHWCIR